MDWRSVEDANEHVVADIRVPGPEGGAECSRLISKAWLIPELEEALRIAVAGFEELHEQEIGCPDCDDEVSCSALAKVRAVLAKLEETP